MKKIVVLLILALLAVYGIGRFNLGEAGAMRFLNKMETLMNEGNASEVCAMFHEDLEVDIADHSGETSQHMSGGKREFCELTRVTVAGLDVLPVSMQVEYTNMKATQTMSSPWSSELRYSEHRRMSVAGANVRLQTVSNDEITLVQTFSGVKLLKLKSTVYKADAA